MKTIPKIICVMTITCLALMGCSKTVTLGKSERKYRLREVQGPKIEARDNSATTAEMLKKCEKALFAANQKRRDSTIELVRSAAGNNRSDGPIAVAASGRYVGDVLVVGLLIYDESGDGSTLSFGDAAEKVIVSAIVPEEVLPVLDRPWRTVICHLRHSDKTAAPIQKISTSDVADPIEINCHINKVRTISVAEKSEVTWMIPIEINPSGKKE